MYLRFLLKLWTDLLLLSPELLLQKTKIGRFPSAISFKEQEAVIF